MGPRLPPCRGPARTGGPSRAEPCPDQGMVHPLAELGRQEVGECSSGVQAEGAVREQGLCVKGLFPLQRPHIRCPLSSGPAPWTDGDGALSNNWTLQDSLQLISCDKF